MRTLTLCICCFLFEIAAVAEPLDFTHRPQAFTGTSQQLTEKLQRQNEKAFAEGVLPVQSIEDIKDRIDQGDLVLVEDGIGYFVDPNMGKGYEHTDMLRYAHPRVVSFLGCLGIEFVRTFGTLQILSENRQLFYVDVEQTAELKVGSLIRTPEWQAAIRNLHGEGNAAPSLCETPVECTPHYTGLATDLSKKNLTLDQIIWLRGELFEMQRDGMLSVIEEMRGNAFHIFVDSTFSCG